jgi:hypothetical protein
MLLFYPPKVQEGFEAGPAHENTTGWFSAIILVSSFEWFDAIEYGYFCSIDH